MCNGSEASDLASMFGIDAPGAILSADGGEVDAYMLTHGLLHAVARKGHGIYTNTNVRNIEYHQRHVELQTQTQTIKAKKVVIACGYESQKYLSEKVSEIHTTYAFVSEPLEDKMLWHTDCLVWETANPYMYFRKVDGNRVLIGGKDDPHHRSTILPSVIRKKADLLAAAFHKRVKDITPRVDFSWGGAFASTSDGLPFIGVVKNRPNTFFALGYGGNGITFSVIAAGLIRDLLAGKQNKHSQLFAFGR
jgi:glycine/D-amino acid oxidase-like deaminating enzyme